MCKKLVQTFNAETWTLMNTESKIQAMNMKVLRQYWKVNKKEQNWILNFGEGNWNLEFINRIEANNSLCRKNG